MTEQEFIDYYQQKVSAAIDELNNDEDSKSKYVAAVNEGLANESDEIKKFALHQLSISHAKDVAILEIIKELVVDEQN